MAELSSASFAALADSANSLAKVGKDVKKGAVLKFTAHLDAVLPVTAAEDSEQDHYDNISEAWERFLPGLEDVSQEWYKDVSEYYESDDIPATVDGVLGGFGDLSDPDVKETKAFLEKYVFKVSPVTKLPLSLDCGAGIGRVSQELLLRYYHRVDVLEQSPKLMKEALYRLPKAAVRKHFLEPLQLFTPEEGIYDSVHIQWVIGYLTDIDLIAFLRRCSRALTSTGFIVMKENTLRKDSALWLDVDDHNAIRSYDYFLEIFKAAELEVVAEEWQKDWPEGVFPVCMWALQPRGRSQKK